MTPLVLAAAFLLAQLPPTPGLQAPRGRVEGVVLKAGTTEPIVGARITLARPNEINVSTSVSTTGPGNSINLFAVPPVPNTPPATPPSIPPMPIAPVFTDNGGRFSFSDLEAGTFRLFVHLDGYVRQEYGQRTFPGQGTPLTLAAGEILKDLTLSTDAGRKYRRTHCRQSGKTCRRSSASIAQGHLQPGGPANFSKLGHRLDERPWRVPVLLDHSGQVLPCCGNTSGSPCQRGLRGRYYQ